MIKKNAFEITMSIMLLTIGFLIGRGVGHRAADRWWKDHGVICGKNPYVKANEFTTEGWTYECLDFDGKTATIRPNYDVAACWPEAKRPAAPPKPH